MKKPEFYCTPNKDCISLEYFKNMLAHRQYQSEMAYRMIFFVNIWDGTYENFKIMTD